LTKENIRVNIKSEIDEVEK